MQIPFNKPFLSKSELNNIVETVKNLHTGGDGPFTKKCHALLEEITGCKKALLTHSCTAALEMAAILIDIQPGDEVIMPSYTFVTTANAFVLRGAVPVFVDIRPDTLNIDETKIEEAITPKTKAIVPMHYAGISCEMDKIMQIAEKHNLFVIEDAAQGILSEYKGKPLGSIGHLGTYSFHETKNIISGEGGALLVNDEKFIERAEIIREKGTNRSKFFRGEIDKYTWVDFSGYEESTHVLNLNDPIPDNLKNTYDWVFEAGTLEHCFDVKQVMFNTVNFVKPGGFVIHVSPMSGWINHGFYQFSPTFFYDFYSANGFDNFYSKVVFYHYDKRKTLTFKNKVVPEIKNQYVPDESSQDIDPYEERTDFNSKKADIIFVAQKTKECELTIPIQHVYKDLE